jgi:hypothetical protein
MPKYCFSCGKPLEMDNAEICPNCGVRLRKRPDPDPCGCSLLFAYIFILLGLVILGASFYNSPWTANDRWLYALFGLISLGGGIYFVAKAWGRI